MNALIPIYALLSVAIPPPQPEVTYGFATSDYTVDMRVRFSAPVLGRRLAFYSNLDPSKEVCYSGSAEESNQCARRFVGAMAIVTYVVKSANRKPLDGQAIREHVTELGHSSGLPARTPFTKTQALVSGTASDLQVFGYDEAAVNKVDRDRTREHMRVQWMLLRQKLYLDRDDKPFAIVEWKHTLDRISIVQIYAPPGTT